MDASAPILFSKVIFSYYIDPFVII